MAENEATEANYTKPPTQEWIEKAADPDYVPSSVKDKGADQELSQDGFVAVDPIYRNSAYEQNLPMEAEDSAEQELINEHVHEDADLSAGLSPEGESEATDEADEESETPSGSGSTSTPTGPAPTQPSN